MQQEDNVKTQEKGSPVTGVMYLIQAKKENVQQSVKGSPRYSYQRMALLTTW